MRSLRGWWGRYDKGEKMTHNVNLFNKITYKEGEKCKIMLERL